MTQKLICQKLLRFVVLMEQECIAKPFDETKTSATKPLKIIEWRQHFEQLKDIIKTGKCFGFSLMHGVVDYFNYLAQWEKMLVAISEWDEEAKSLNKTIFLNPNEAGLSLRTLCHLVLSNILYCHGSLKTLGFAPSHLTQHTIMKPDKVIQGRLQNSLLDFRNKGTNYSIKKYHIISGDFNLSMLEQLLCKDKLENTICLAHNDEHTIRIGYKNGNWIAYDCNDKPKLNQTLQFFKDKCQLIHTIFEKLGSSLTLENGSFDNKEVEFSEYKNLLISEPLTLLANNGFALMARDTPDVLTDFIDGFPDKAILCDVLATALNRTNDEGNGLHTLAHYCPAIVPQLLALTELPQGKILKESILLNLFKSDGNKFIPLQKMINQNSDFLPNLYLFLHHFQWHKKVMLRLLLQSNLNEKCCFQRLLLETPLVWERFAQLATAPGNEELAMAIHAVSKKDKKENHLGHSRESGNLHNKKR